LNSQAGQVVVLDRDGVINRESASFIKTPQEWQPLPGSMEAIGRLSRAGYRLALATNQSGLARGLFDEAALAAIHRKLTACAAEHGGKIDGIFFCPHGPGEGCRCRKPATGLLEQIESSLGCELRGRWFVGDSLRDLIAARDHGCQPVLVRTGNGIATEKLLENNNLNDVFVFDDLLEAACALLRAKNWRKPKSG